jgi:hypothetical protein
MKKLATILLMLGATLSAADYSGTYTGKGGIEDARYGSVPQTAQLTVLQSGSTFKGTMKLGNGKPAQITSGTVTGTQLTFVVTPNGGKQITGHLSQTGAGLAGKMTSSTGKVFDVVFTKN